MFNTTTYNTQQYNTPASLLAAIVKVIISQAVILGSNDMSISLTGNPRDAVELYQESTELIL